MHYLYDATKQKMYAERTTMPIDIGNKCRIALYWAVSIYSSYMEQSWPVNPLSIEYAHRQNF